MVPKHLTEIPDREVIAPGQVVVHNSVRPTRKLGSRGFRAWVATPDEWLERCSCGWAPELGEHYRVAAAGKDADR